MTTDILTPVGRSVQGHPMELRPVTDDHGQPKINKAGQQQQQVFVALAIPKQGESDWQQTEWGQQIVAAGQQGWPNGEWKSPTFAWKIYDGDSQIPNKKGKRPCDQEGMPGHWIVNATNGFMPDCFAHGNYQQQVMRKETFKTGDYVRLLISVVGNAPSQSPGVYINLKGCELVQAGQQIVSASSIDGQATFGSVPAQLPAGAVVDPNMANQAPVQQPTAPPPVQQQAAPPPVQQQAAPPPVQPAHDFLTVNGQQYTADQLRQANWTEEQINAARG